VLCIPRSICLSVCLSPWRDGETRAVILLDGSSCRNTGLSKSVDTHANKRVTFWFSILLGRHFTLLYLFFSWIRFLLFSFSIWFLSLCVSCERPRLVAVSTGCYLFSSYFDRHFPWGCLLGGTGRPWLKENIARAKSYWIHISSLLI
jgi:hypothetical protein